MEYRGTSIISHAIGITVSFPVTLRPMANLDRRSEAALLASIQSIEARSGAEVVVAIRPRSGSYLHISLALALGAGLASLLFLLYMPWPVPWLFLWLQPAAFASLTAVLSAKAPFLQRRLSRQHTMRAAAERAARSLFVEKGVHGTKERVGILVFVSQLENTCTVVSDIGIGQCLPARDWDKATSALQAVLTDTGKIEPLAETLASLGDLLEFYIPRDVDDVNELPDALLS